VAWAAWEETLDRAELTLMARWALPSPALGEQVETVEWEEPKLRVPRQGTVEMVDAAGMVVWAWGLAAPAERVEQVELQ
jgi:hypothetical protein